MSIIEEVSLTMYKNWQPRLLTCVRCEDPAEKALYSIDAFLLA